MVRPSSRGGVPVFSRPSANPRRSSVAERPDGRRLADPAGRDLLLADMDQAAQERAGGQDHGAGRKFAAIGQANAGNARRSRSEDRRPRLRSQSSSAFRGSPPASRRRKACGRPGRADPAPPGLCGGSARETGCRPGRRPGPSGRPARRFRGPDGPCRARRWPDCRTSRRSSQNRWVTRAVRAPMRAAAAAASQPAWPPPITMTSKESMARPRIAVLLAEPFVAVKMVFHVKPASTFHVKQRNESNYFPMQKSRKITSRMSSTSTRPVSRPSV